MSARRRPGSPRNSRAGTRTGAPVSLSPGPSMPWRTSGSSARCWKTCWVTPGSSPTAGTIRRSSSEPRRAGTPPCATTSATTARASIPSMRASCSSRSSGCIRPAISPAPVPAPAWPPCGRSWNSTAAGPGPRAPSERARPSTSPLTVRKAHDYSHHLAGRGQSRRRGADAEGLQEKQHPQRDRGGPGRRRGAGVPLPRRQRHAEPGSDPARLEPPEDRRAGGAAQDAPRRPAGADPGGGPDQLQTRRGHPGQLPQRRQCLRAKTGQVLRLHPGRQRPRRVLAAHERARTQPRVGKRDRGRALMNSEPQRDQPETAVLETLAVPAQASAGTAGQAVPTGRHARILILEDEAWDAALAQRLLTGAGLQLTAVVVDTKALFIEQLATFQPEVILSDYHLPGFSGREALKIAQEVDPDIPFIIWSGVLGDEAAVELIKQGATDYVLKDRPARLPTVILRALAESERRARLAQLEDRLLQAQRLASLGQLAAAEEAMTEVRRLLST